MNSFSSVLTSLLSEGRAASNRRKNWAVKKIRNKLHFLRGIILFFEFLTLRTWKANCKELAESQGYVLLSAGFYVATVQVEDAEKTYGSGILTDLMSFWWFNNTYYNLTFNVHFTVLLCSTRCPPVSIHSNPRSFVFSFLTVKSSWWNGSEGKVSHTWREYCHFLIFSKLSGLLGSSVDVLRLVKERLQRFFQRGTVHLTNNISLLNSSLDALTNNSS